MHWVSVRVMCRYLFFFGLLVALALIMAGGVFGAWGDEKELFLFFCLCSCVFVCRFPNWQYSRCLFDLLKEYDACSTALCKVPIVSMIAWSEYYNHVSLAIRHRTDCTSLPLLPLKDDLLCYFSSIILPNLVIYFISCRLEASIWAAAEGPACSGGTTPVKRPAVQAPLARLATSGRVASTGCG